MREMTNEIEVAEHRLTLEASGQALASGKFEVLAITAGEGNGWQFPAEVLRASLALWDGVTCFIDHDRKARSVRDIGGVLESPVWDEAVQGIRATLTAAGPGGPVLTALGQEVLAGEAGSQPKVGFSADVLFYGKSGPGGADHQGLFGGPGLRTRPRRRIRAQFESKPILRWRKSDDGTSTTKPARSDGAG